MGRRRRSCCGRRRRCHGFGRRGRTPIAFRSPGATSRRRRLTRRRRRVTASVWVARSSGPARPLRAAGCGVGVIRGCRPGRLDASVRAGGALRRTMPCRRGVRRRRGAGTCFGTRRHALTWAQRRCAGRGVFCCLLLDRPTGGRAGRILAGTRWVRSTRVSRRGLLAAHVLRGIVRVRRRGDRWRDGRGGGAGLRARLGRCRRRCGSGQSGNIAGFERHLQRADQVIDADEQISRLLLDDLQAIDSRRFIGHRGWFRFA